MANDKIKPIEAPFVVPANRTAVTGEPERTRTGYDPQYPDVSWLGTEQYGGGHMPEDYQWPTNPKERQDELMGDSPH
ncbi:MAG TPA: hypothetical protein VF794_07505 [Archangium sp.]|jgi:hypothetical protein|uniref:hypothetical protein n=1 Tax=Archangium sp. TaxID=1872627 RepID=UPI002EDAE8B9